jgi:hypothetical protein
MPGWIAPATLPVATVLCVRVVACERSSSSPPQGQVHQVASCNHMGWLFRVDGVSQPTYTEERQIVMAYHLGGIHYLQCQ